MIATIRIPAAPDNLIFAVRAAKHVIENPETKIGFRHGPLFQYGDGDAAVQFYAWRNKRSIGEAQQVDSITAEDGQARILGIETTARAIIDAVWSAAIEAAAKLFEPSCSCPEPCDDYWIWPSPCATKAAERIRSLRRPDAVPAREPQ